jgi:UDP-GlcNAc:undecaprenyl-phosphate/decaprenyl-phosphate GlcNAc-1-phosphate transferase
MGALPVPAQMLLVFAVALGGALALVPLAAAIGSAVGGALVDRPRPGELQRRPIARTGGYGIVAAFFLALLVSIPITDRSYNGFEELPKLAGLAFGAALLVPFAAWDDAKRLPPLPQLVAQIGCALLPVLFGVRIERISNFDIGRVAPWIIGPLSVLWIVGMINALNWLDTMDGLAGGVSFIGALVLFGASIVQRGPQGQPEPQNSIGLLGLALAGACLGFLAYNFPPARIFMGTGGSMFLGYALGVISIIGGAKIATAVLVLGLPILDTALVILQRLLRGRSPFRGGDGAHLVHRLIAAGLSVRQIVALVYGITALFGILALTLVGQQKIIGFSLLAAIVGGLLLALRRRTARLTGQAKGGEGQGSRA